MSSITLGSTATILRGLPFLNRPPLGSATHLKPRGARAPQRRPWRNDPPAPTVPPDSKVRSVRFSGTQITTLVWRSRAPPGHLGCAGAHLGGIWVGAPRPF